MLVALAPAPATGDACDDGVLPSGIGRRAGSSRYDVVFRPTPAPITVGRHFSIEARVCPRAGAPAPAGLRVDAVMPEHRHGMNYRPSVSARGAGRFVADGLMLHMPGRWQLVFEVESGAGTERLVADIVLE